jgi:uncharacterized protein YbjT (DUF2867 family)
MRMLVIGGSSFVGRHMVAAALERGHDVTLFNRGRTDPGAFPGATHLVGDRDRDLSALAGGEWDATVDVCAYVPRQVRSLLDALGGRGGHYTLVSTISVYDHERLTPGFDESAPLLAPAWDDEPAMERYGALKVACEQVARELAGEGLLVVRPGYVLGPHDPTHRFTYWVERIADGRRPVAGPDADQPLQGDRRARPRRLRRRPGGTARRRHRPRHRARRPADVRRGAGPGRGGSGRRSAGGAAMGRHEGRAAAVRAAAVVADDAGRAGTRTGRWTVVAPAVGHRPRHARVGAYGARRGPLRAATGSRARPRRGGGAARRSAGLNAHHR